MLSAPGSDFRRETLKRAQVHDQSDRNVIARFLVQCQDRTPDAWADLIDSLSVDAETMKNVFRTLADIEASE
jgi:hypothetical protein